MYRRHKVLLTLCFVGVSIAAFVLRLNFTEMAETSITVASIAMGVYVAAVSALLGSKYAKNLSQITDSEDSSKTLLGVLAGYFRCAGKWCISIILVGCVYQIPSKWQYPFIIVRLSSAVSYGIFSINIVLFWLILGFLVNSLNKSVR